MGWWFYIRYIIIHDNLDNLAKLFTNSLLYLDWHDFLIDGPCLSNKHWDFNVFSTGAKVVAADVVFICSILSYLLLHLVSTKNTKQTSKQIINIKLNYTHNIWLISWFLSISINFLTTNFNYYIENNLETQFFVDNIYIILTNITKRMQN